MTDLDRQIAEIKGYWTKNWPVVCENPEYKEETRVICNWSTSDSKALELVDELTLVRADRLCSFGFNLGVNLGEWQAVFFPDPYPRHEDRLVHALKNCAGKSPTRPEAICRAYIAAVTWMRGRG